MTTIRTIKDSCNIEDLWLFSSEFYALDTNKKSLLFLQDEADINVNVVIFCFYLCTKGILINTHAIAYFIQKNAKLDSLTSKLRAHRRESKPIGNSLDEEGLDKYYKSLLAKELEHEKQQQSLLLESFFELLNQSMMPSESDNRGDMPYFQKANVVEQKTIREIDEEADNIVAVIIKCYQIDSLAIDNHLHKVASVFRRYAISELT